MTIRRTQLFLDRVQLVLIGRVVGYWFFCLLAAALMACCWTICTDPPASSGELFARVVQRYGLVLVSTVIVLPLVIVDVLRVSHRFVGPVFRFRNALKQAAQGHTVEPILLRDNDFWRDVADDFNRALVTTQDPPTHAA